MNWIFVIIAFFDRNWNLLFHKKKCWKLTMDEHWLGYCDIIEFPNKEQARCLGNNWFKKYES